MVRDVFCGRFARLRADQNGIRALSPSQVRTFMDCQMRWWFKYGLKVPDPACGAACPD